MPWCKRCSKCCYVWLSFHGLPSLWSSEWNVPKRKSPRYYRKWNTLYTDDWAGQNEAFRVYWGFWCTGLVLVNICQVWTMSSLLATNMHFASIEVVQVLVCPRKQMWVHTWWCIRLYLVNEILLHQQACESTIHVVSGCSLSLQYIDGKLRCKHRSALGMSIPVSQ